MLPSHCRSHFAPIDTFTMPTVRNLERPVAIGCPNMTTTITTFISDLPRYLVTRIGR